MDLFAEAVRATVMRWTALNLAVSYQFGDGHSENHRREELIQQTVAGFASAHAANKRCARPPARARSQRCPPCCAPGRFRRARARTHTHTHTHTGRDARCRSRARAARRAPDPTELEEFLDTYMQDNFNMFADDESPHEVSILIARLYELIAANRIEEAQQLLAAPTASLDACVAVVRCPPGSLSTRPVCCAKVGCVQRGARHVAGGVAGTRVCVRHGANWTAPRHEHAPAVGDRNGVAKL